MESILQFLWTCNLSQIILISSIENILIVIISLIIGWLIVKAFKKNKVCQVPEQIKSQEIILTLSTLLINTLITIIGWMMWKEGLIIIKATTNFWIVLVDIFVLFCAMDISMYVLHRMAHIQFIFPILHQTHHQYVRVRPITLFVLNPLETLSFGALWLILIYFYSASAIAISIYLALNVIFGIVGHLGVEPISKKVASLPIVNLLTTSTFHAQHHLMPEQNFGFYTTIWDKLFKSLSPFYHSHFGKVVEK